MKRDDDVTDIGRSPLWAGDPVLDGELFYRQNNMEPESLGIVPDAMTSEVPDTFTCAYCGTELPEILPEEGEIHQCWGFVIPGSVVKLDDTRYALVLEADSEHVVYQEIKKFESTTIEKSPKDFLNEQVR